MGSASFGIKYRLETLNARDLGLRCGPKTYVNMSHNSLNSLKGGLYRGLYRGVLQGVIKGDTRSLDYGSYDRVLEFSFQSNSLQNSPVNGRTLVR